ncbi:uncharacterized protein LOC109863113 [Pseudomyrmex gracilis]|uniref:uncharacterized protein LOC109863113 n=1 Tax=Pseudomyrmex gracilis TaxID=219809 RepID=UPI000995BBE6|nr:uncharacterized protein LOC109863113 [Pseudomyrmex gracilis]
MAIFRKYCRKPNQPLQQFFNRMAEKQINDINDNHEIDSSIRASMSHNSDSSNRPQYRKIQFNKISLSIDERDNCCILRDGSICIVFNIVMNNNSYLLGVKKFLEIEDFYNIECLFVHRKTKMEKIIWKRCNMWSLLLYIVKEST